MTQAGPAIPVVTATDAPDAGPALRVAVVSDGRPTEAGPARRVVVVSDGRPTQGNDPVPVVVAMGAQAAGPIAGPPIPVVVVSGSLSPTTIYTNKVKALSPIAYWPLAESSGTTAVDESGNGRNGTYSNITLGATGIGDGRTAATLVPASNSVINVFSASFQSAFNGAAGTVAGWGIVNAAGVWTDGAARQCFRFLVNGSNLVLVRKSATNNTLTFQYTAGGTTVSVNNAMSPTVYFHWAITWNKAADQMKAYINGAQVGATQTGLGVWAGSLSSSATLIGAASTTPTEVWSGTLAHVAVFTTVLSATNILSLATVP